MHDYEFDRPGPDFAPEAARFTPPAGAVDCHCHVFGPFDQFPYAEDRSYTPPAAILEDYQAMLAATGLERSIMVQPSVYGFDNSASLDAMRAMDGKMRGVMVAPNDVTDQVLQDMHEAGARGLRFNVDLKGGVGFDDLETLAARIKPMDWHIQVFAQPSTFLEAAHRLEELPCDVVIDHMGHVPAADGVHDLAFQRLLAMLRAGRTWVKVSGPYRLTSNPPPYDEALPMARALIAEAPEKCVFGTDWPHPNFDGPMPNDSALLNFLDDASPDDATRDAILVANPERLYGF
jgi:predicted TIM-barrel fold metal-dependent hydrolase